MGDDMVRTKPKLSILFRFAVGIMVAMGAFVLLLTLAEGDIWYLTREPFLLLVIVGAFSSGWVMATGFGRPGLEGWVIGLFTYLFCTSAAGGIGVSISGTIALTGIGGGFLHEDGSAMSLVEAMLTASLYSFFTIFAAPFLAISAVFKGNFTWPISLIIIQLIARWLRPRLNVATSDDAASVE